ncbi:putative protein kinase [Trypanosoma vivax]|nr:putative protein kinase [Trypanosoma vivax]
MAGLKINVDELDSDSDNAVLMFKEVLQFGELTVSSDGLTTSRGQKYGLSPEDVLASTTGFLGRGSSGSVRRVTHRKTGKDLALKEIKQTGQSHFTEIKRELETLHRGANPSPYLVDFYGAFCHEGSVFIAMECMDGSLDAVDSPVPVDVLACVTRSILRSLFYLHKTRHLIHRDIKPNNILYSCHGDIKISDFGVSSCLEYTRGSALSFVGTLTYMSPERLKGESYSFSADIWSLGLVVAELALGSCPFAQKLSRSNGSTEGRFWILLEHLNSDAPVITLPPSMDASLADFISACIQRDPQERPSCDQLFRHPFVEGGDEMEDRRTIKEWISSMHGESSVSRRFSVSLTSSTHMRTGSEASLNLDDELSKLIK